MKSSCIAHPEREPIIVLRKWQVSACDGNHCAAALLSFFEYWHNIKLDMQAKAAYANKVAVNHGDEPTQDESLLQFHNADQLSEGVLGLYSEKTIRSAISLLVNKGFISVQKNPNPRYKFDQTKYFLFDAKAVNIACGKNSNIVTANLPEPVGEIAEPSGEIAEPSGEIAGTITETPFRDYDTESGSRQVASDTLGGDKAETERAKEANKATWQAYAAAYEKRYGVAPMRNAQANGIIAKFVKAVGQDDAPRIARFYVNMNTEFYVRKLHDLKSLGGDAQSIRTQWATNRTVSATQARQADIVQAAKSGVETAAERYAKRRAAEQAESDIINGECRHV